MATTSPTSSATATAGSSPDASTRRTVMLTAAGVVVAALCTSLVAVVATALGYADGFAPLRPAIYLPFVAIGVIAGVIGWRIVRSRAKHPLAVLRVLVPAVLVASFVPDTILVLTRFIPGTTLLGGISLAVMHLIVAAVTVPLAQRIARVTR